MSEFLELSKTVWRFFAAEIKQDNIVVDFPIKLGFIDNMIDDGFVEWLEEQGYSSRGEMAGKGPIDCVVIRSGFFNHRDPIGLLEEIGRTLSSKGNLLIFKIKQESNIFGIDTERMQKLLWLSGFSVIKNMERGDLEVFWCEKR